jgi:hypothetical protein
MNNFIVISRFSPDSVAGDSHSAEPKAIDREIASDAEYAALSYGLFAERSVLGDRAWLLRLFYCHRYLRDISLTNLSTFQGASALR